MTIGQNLKRLRGEKGLSQLELARRSGVSQQLISQIENEITESTRSTPKLALALGVDVAELDHTFPGATLGRKRVTHVPVLTQEQIVRGAFTVENGDAISITDLAAGDWFATIPQDDAMDRVAPAGAVVLFNRSERTLEDGGLYLFTDGMNAFIRRYRDGDTGKLLPLSINPEHLAIPFSRDSHIVIGRCRRSVLEL